MAFSDALRKLGTFVGLYGKEPEPGYPGDGYDSGYANEYFRPDEYYGGSYQEPYQEEEPVYQTGYGATGPYARAGAKPKQPSPPRQGSAQGNQSRSGTRPHQTRPDNVIPMRERESTPRAYEAPAAADYPRETRTSGGRTIIFCARRKEDSEQIITKMVEGFTVALNLEELDDMQYRRLLDLVSGAAFAIGASVVRTSHKGYLIAPEGVIVMGGDEPQGREAREPREPRDGYYSSSR